jgi:hypothetical protein
VHSWSRCFCNARFFLRPCWHSPNGDAITNSSLGDATTEPADHQLETWNCSTKVRHVWALFLTFPVDSSWHEGQSRWCVNVPEASVRCCDQRAWCQSVLR